jgi:hypothetical protein
MIVPSSVKAPCERIASVREPVAVIVTPEGMFTVAKQNTAMFPWTTPLNVAPPVIVGGVAPVLMVTAVAGFKFPNDVKAPGLSGAA